MSVDAGLDLDRLVDMNATVRCQWQLTRCETPARWVMVQLHLRPPLPCIRTNLCTEHQQRVKAAEDKLAADHTHGPVVCTLHVRPVELRARWEPL